MYINSLSRRPVVCQNNIILYGIWDLSNVCSWSFAQLNISQCSPMLLLFQQETNRYRIAKLNCSIFVGPKEHLLNLQWKHLFSLVGSLKEITEKKRLTDKK